MGRPRKPPSEQLTFAADLRAAVAAVHERSTTITWPSPRWRNDPCGFARDVLGLRLWSRQHELIDSVRQHPRTACRSGRRTGKSTSIGVLALWRFCSFDRGQVLLTSTTSAQLDGILWTEIKRLAANSGLCADCREADPNQPRPCPHSAVITEIPKATSKGGLKGADARYPRYIIGKTARKVDALLGFGGPECLVLADECSGIPDEIFPALTGMLAGGGAAMFCGNMTKRVGYFADTFLRKKTWTTLKISSRETPNYVEGRTVIPGLAERAWVDGEIEDHGENSAYVAVHIDGEFASLESGGIFPGELLDESTARDKVPNPRSPLVIGLDPAGDGASGNKADETALCAVRGNVMLDLFAQSGLDESGILQALLEMIRDLSNEDETPRVHIDAEGEIGLRVHTYLRAHAVTSGDFEIHPVRGWDKPKEPAKYAQTRDEVVIHAAQWLRAGGAIIGDQTMLEELTAFRTIEPDSKGKVRVVSKRDLRKVLRRSPDRTDAFCMAVYEPQDAGVREQMRKQLENRAHQQHEAAERRMAEKVAARSAGGRSYWSRDRE